jgi:hypothetical protein
MDLWDVDLQDQQQQMTCGHHHNRLTNNIHIKTLTTISLRLNSHTVAIMDRILEETTHINQMKASAIFTMPTTSRNHLLMETMTIFHQGARGGEYLWMMGIECPNGDKSTATHLQVILNLSLTTALKSSLNLLYMKW